MCRKWCSARPWIIQHSYVIWHQNKWPPFAFTSQSGWSGIKTLGLFQICTASRILPIASVRQLSFQHCSFVLCQLIWVQQIEFKGQKGKKIDWLKKLKYFFKTDLKKLKQLNETTKHFMKSVFQSKIESRCQQQPIIGLSMFSSNLWFHQKLLLVWQCCWPRKES